MEAYRLDEQVAKKLYLEAVQGKLKDAVNQSMQGGEYTVEVTRDWREGEKTHRGGEEA